MKCPFCNLDVKPWDEPRKGHLIVTKNSKDNHFHTHGEFNNKELMRELIDVASLEANISRNIDKLDRKECVFHNRQRIGDILMMSCAIRDFHNAYPDVRINVTTTAMHIWDHNPNIDSTLVSTPENTIKIGPSKGTNQSNRIDWHFANAYRISIEDALNIHIQQGESRADIYFTQEEYNAERITKDPYWVIITSGEKGWGCKMYPFDKWQEFINQNQDKLFYQLGASEEHIPRLQGKNVVDYVGKTQDRNTGIRDLFKLFLNAEGSIGLVSFHMHLSGALYKPTVVIAGAREPVSFTRYQGQQYLSTEGCLQCAATTACWHCDISACPNLVIKGEEKIPKCVDMIQPEDITRAINSYYIGGRLKLGIVSQKPKLKNIVKTPSKVIVAADEPISDVKSKYGLEFGGGCLTENDWKFIKATIKENNIKTILEFGAGLSTLLLNELGLKVITYETYNGWIEKIKALNDKCVVRLWDGKSIDNVEKADFAFVDGPAGGINREFSTKIASEVAEILIIHDAGREHEKNWQEKYIKGKFIGPGGGGNRCHLWSKNKNTKIAFRTGSPLMMSKPSIEEEKSKFEVQKCSKSTIVEPINEVEQKYDDKSSDLVVFTQSKKFIKFVSTARGWGGCARSCVTIMKMLLKEGHKVEFIPFRNKVSSKEYQQHIKDNLQDLIITENYNTLNEHCDILIIYADDFVWEFSKQEICDIFSYINAERKIMILNYRRGKVGEVEWTKNFDKFMFLNSTQEKELLKVLPNAKTKVLAPCTELEEFFKVQPNYNNNLRIVRHSSQGDTKFSKNFQEEIDAILNSRNDVEIKMMPGPSFINSSDRFKKYTRNEISIPKFLQLGNLFVYSLPKEPTKYFDMGPRVVLEAMAAGLPILADNWGGVKDRLGPHEYEEGDPIVDEYPAGWLCDEKSQYIDIIENIMPEALKLKGEKAREKARKEFIPSNWIREIINA